MTKTLSRSTIVGLSLCVLLTAGCVRLPEAEEPAAGATLIWGASTFNDSIDIAEVWMDSAGEDNLFTLFYSVNKLHWKQPLTVDARLYANGNFAIHREATAFHIAYTDSPGVILRFGPDGTPVKTEYPDTRLPSSSLFGRLGNHYVFLGDSTLSVLDGQTLSQTTYSAYVQAGMRRMSHAAINGETLTLLEDRGDTLCFFRKTATSVRTFCQVDTLPSASLFLGIDSLKSWRWDDTAFAYALDFEAGRYQFVSKGWAYTVSTGSLNPLHSSKEFLRYLGGDLKYQLRDFKVPKPTAQ
jgi:hypothetical protein